MQWEKNNFQKEEEYFNSVEEIIRNKLEKSPYFGRLDFTENATGEESAIYIGIYSLMKDGSHEIYVVERRASISSMFYQFDLGSAWYEIRNQKEKVRITKKRQYRIEDSRLLTVYDTDSSMYDDILGEVLSKNSNHELKVIIGSIQKERNLAIQDAPA